MAEDRKLQEIVREGFEGLSHTSSWEEMMEGPQNNYQNNWETYMAIQAFGMIFRLLQNSILRSCVYNHNFKGFRIFSASQFCYSIN